jgi:hypothetical protein
MTDTVKVGLDPLKLNRDVHNRVNGVDIACGLSPFDIPSSVEGRCDARPGWFVIQFNYLPTHENRIAVGDHSQPILLYVGEHSGRLYEIHIDTTIGASTVLTKTEEAIDNLRSQKSANRLAGYYQMVNGVVADSAGKLFAGSALGW